MKVGVKERLAKSGFTLVELLVAIGILAVLMTISFIAYQKITMRTRSVASVSTLKNLGMALASYVTDHGELPGKAHTNHPPQYKIANRIWTPLWPYLGYQKRPEQDSILSELVPAHWIAWLKANPGGTPYLYKIANPVYLNKTDKVIFWGYPGSDEQRARWSTIAQLPLASTVAVQDCYAAPGEDGPKKGELQDYTTYLYFDWHVEVKPQQ